MESTRALLVWDTEPRPSWRGRGEDNLDFLEGEWGSSSERAGHALNFLFEGSNRGGVGLRVGGGLGVGGGLWMSGVGMDLLDWW
jgi:hypothetical protein